jgi:hypothetical protein
MMSALSPFERSTIIWIIPPTTVRTNLSGSLPVARPTVVWVKLPDGAVLFMPETEVYYGMNLVAASAWELLPQSGDSMDQLCSLIRERFPDAALEQIRTDMTALFDDLDRAGLVDRTSTKSAA